MIADSLKNREEKGGKRDALGSAEPAAFLGRLKTDSLPPHVL
jgi:hypothetical protein